MTEQEAELLAAKLTKIWAPESALMPIDWHFNEKSASFALGVIPHVEVTIFILQAIGTRVRLSYDYFDTECSQGRITQTYRDTLRPENGEFVEAFVEQLMPDFLRGCWLSGCSLDCSAHEQLEWTQWLQKQNVAPTSGLVKDVDREACRVAAAFGAATFQETTYSGSRRAFRAQIGHVTLDWHFTREGELRDLHLKNPDEDTSFNVFYYERDFNEEEDIWYSTGSSSHNRGMAEGLYCLDFKSRIVWAELNSPLSSDEQRHLRDWMPREFWPQRWLEEPIEEGSIYPPCLEAGIRL